MISQTQTLIDKSEGRYARDEELTFLSGYVDSFALRVQTYLALQSAEAEIVQGVLSRLKAKDPNLLLQASQDLTPKWKMDTLRVLRLSAAALLSDDIETYHEQFLLWFQTVMRAFGAQRACDVTYTIMLEVVRRHLTPAQATLFCPILERNHQVLTLGLNSR